jgi:hypothetical protein
MNEFELFKKVIVGDFNNLAQIEDQKKKGKITHPIAKHINRICNDKIDNLPKDFKGIFVIEESYYTFVDTNRTNILPHLFLFEETEEGRVKLISYEIPKSINKKDFTNSNENLRMDYNELEISQKFNPMVYTYKENIGFHGRSLSNFGPDTTFLLDETLSEDKFEVNEILKKGDRVLVGFDSPIIYTRE